MRLRRRGLSARMLWLTRWYAGHSEPRMRAASKRAAEDWVAGIGAIVITTGTAPHGRSRRDGKRP